MNSPLLGSSRTATLTAGFPTSLKLVSTTDMPERLWEEQRFAVLGRKALLNEINAV
jgi:hypothetical protein